jgi:uncharacterized protein YjdB
MLNMSIAYRSRINSALAALLVGAALTACGGDSSTGTDDVASVTLDPTSASLEVGATRQFTATPRNAGGAALTGRVVTWSTSNGAVASVSSTGLVTALTVGTATITARSEGEEGTAGITVALAPVSLVEVNPATASMAIGDTVTISATPRDAQGNPLAGRTVTWSSSNNAVATVSTSGLVTAQALGTANIIATSEGEEGTTVVTVTNTPPAPDNTAPLLVSLSIDPDTVDVSTQMDTTFVTLNVTDAQSGVQSVTINFRSPGNDRTLASFVNAPIGGTRADGTWRARVTVPTDAAAGNWTLYNVVLFDAAGNMRVLTTAQLQAAGFETLLHVRR